MYCFDTNIIIDIFRGDEDLKSRLEGLKDLEIFITPITLCELYKGAYLFHDATEKVKAVDDFLSLFKVLDFDENCCKEFGKEYSRLKKLGKMTSEFDLMIASIAKTNDLILITRNKKDFDNINLKTEVW